MQYINPIIEMIQIKKLSEFKKKLDHPYRIGEFLQLENGNLVEVPDNDSDIEGLLNTGSQIYYGINYEDDNLYFENGKKIPMVYGNI